MLLDESQDIIFVTESWLNQNHTDAEFSIDNYDLFRQDRNGNKHGGGVAIYIKSGLSAKLVKRSSVSIVDNSYESVWITITQKARQVKMSRIEVQNKPHTILIACIYRPPCLTSSSAKNIAKHISGSLADINHSSAIICGDLNLNSVDWIENTFPSHLSELRRMFETVGLIQHVTQQTRKSQTLDLIFTSDNVTVKNIIINPPLMSSSHYTESDHSIVEATLYLPDFVNILKRTSCIIKPNFRRTNWDNLKLSWNELPLYNLIQCRNVQSYWDTLKSLIEKIINTNVPMCKVKRSNSVRVPWYTREIKQAINSRKEKWTAYYCNPCEFTLTEYRLSRNKVVSQVRKARELYEVSIAENSRINIKHFYAYANRNKTQQLTPTSLLIADGTHTKTLKDTAQLLNNYFVSVFTPVTNDFNSPKFLKTITKPKYMYIVTAASVIEQLKKLEKNKAPGTDGIKNEFLANMKTELATILAKLFQYSLYYSALPTDWLQANIIPLYKSGNKDQKENFRPVSLTSNVCKLMERIIYDWIVDFLNKECPLYKSQHGFQKGQSCVTQLLEHSNTITLALNDKFSVDVVYLDFSKAFDKVSHSHLIYKMRSKQIPEQLIKWTQAFLTNRRQRVVLQGEYSEWLPVTSGVPQGSVLGPLLFSIYIDDLDEILAPNTIIGKFADDTKLTQIYRQENMSEETRKLQMSIDNIGKWCTTWELPINSSKCAVIHYGKSNIVNTYYINGVIIPKVNEVRDLGILQSNNSKYKTHIQNISKKARKIAGLLLRTFRSRHPKVLLPIYKALIRPLVEYGTSVWNSQNKKDIKEIEHVQRFFTKKISGLSRLNYNSRLLKLELPTLELRRSYFDILMCHKLLHKLVSSKCSEQLKIRQGRTRGHQFKLMGQMSVVSESRRRFYTERIVNPWNKLPAEIADITDHNLFKSAIRKHLQIK